MIPGWMDDGTYKRADGWDRVPDVTGQWGMAWRTRWKPDASATLGDYLLECPASNPMWWWYYAAVIHLRDEPGVPEARVEYAGATHEIMVAALDPSHVLADPHTEHALTPTMLLQPIDQLHQFIANDDESALEILGLAVQACCRGHLIPDGDYRAVWHQAINTTAEHSRLGGHPE